MAAQEKADGSIVSAGEFQGESGIIYWHATSTIIPGTDFHVTRWVFNSPAAFGDATIGIYTDIDVDDSPAKDKLIVGGTGHQNRLLVTNENGTAGVAVGLRNEKNARKLGWLASHDVYHSHGGNIYTSDMLGGADSRWRRFTPNATYYPDADGYGPADVSIAQGIKLKPSAKLAMFETTVVGAPGGYIE